MRQPVSFAGPILEIEYEWHGSLKCDEYGASAYVPK